MSINFHKEQCDKFFNTNPQPPPQEGVLNATKIHYNVLFNILSPACKAELLKGMQRAVSVKGNSQA